MSVASALTVSYRARVLLTWSYRSDARRMLTQGGVKLDGEPLAGEDLDLPRERLDGAVLQVGKRHFRRLRVS